MKETSRYLTSSNRFFAEPGNIIFEDSHIIALNKPAGILTIPDRYDEALISLYKMLETKYQKIFIVHRLDRDTSGIVLFAKNESAHKYFSRLFEEREIEKYYLGIIQGSLPYKTGSIDEPIAEHASRKGLMAVNRKGKESVTEYEVLEEFGFYSLVRYRIHTGRTHQIRVHMQHLGHPLICDELYGNGQPVLLSSFKKKYRLGENAEERPMLSRLALHSSELTFIDDSGISQSLTAPLPRDMSALLKQLRKYNVKTG